MAIKKTDLYSSLWAGCDKLRGGMDASQYKDYILTLLFMKYVTDKYKGIPYAAIKVFDKAHDPEPDPDKRVGASFDDLVALKGNKNIGEGIDKVIARLAEENEQLKGVITIAHFNDEQKMGSGQEMVEKLTGLIAIFQNPDLDFSKNRAEGDDIIGDAYEYLMRHFATESGKSKGQFYTPAEVSRILAQVLKIDKCTEQAEICDPACGSGSLLIRAVAEAGYAPVTGYGQEKDTSTAGLAKMNAVLHDMAHVDIRSGNTFSNPQFLDERDNSELKRFDFVVANPPFSMKNWTDGVKEYGRFDGYGARPPDNNGDYAWLMHILKVLKPNKGKAAVILPHGVLFRGAAPGAIRQSIIDRGWIKGIISLPSNLFYGTGIPACILVIDKENAENRSGIFMIDASRGFVKDGAKNRLREQDIYKVVTTFNDQIEEEGYSRFVKYNEIKQENEYNLNISRYIDSSTPEDTQDIYAHLYGGIPQADIEDLQLFWSVYPNLRDALLAQREAGYFDLAVPRNELRHAIYGDEEFAGYGTIIANAFERWRTFADGQLSGVTQNTRTKELSALLAERLLEEFKDVSLVDKYDVYQVLLGYWQEVMNDDVSLVVFEKDGFALGRETEDIMGEYASGKKKGEPKVVGWEGKLIPKQLIIENLLAEKKAAIDAANETIVAHEACLQSLIEEADEDSELGRIVGDDGKVKAKDLSEAMERIMADVASPEIEELLALAEYVNSKPGKAKLTAYVAKHPACISAVNEKGNVTKGGIKAALSQARSELQPPRCYANDYEELQAALDFCAKIDEQGKLVKQLEKELDAEAREVYATLTDEQIHELLFDRKWFYAIGNGIMGLYEAISHRLADRLIELDECYADTLPVLQAQVEDSEAKVKAHLEKMGFSW